MQCFVSIFCRMIEKKSSNLSKLIQRNFYQTKSSQLKVERNKKRIFWSLRAVQNSIFIVFHSYLDTEYPIEKNKNLTVKRASLKMTGKLVRGISAILYRSENWKAAINWFFFFLSWYYFIFISIKKIAFLFSRSPLYPLSFPSESSEIVLTWKQNSFSIRISY